MRKRGTVNRKDTAKMREKKTLRHVRRGVTYTIVASDGRVMRWRVMMRDGSFALVRIL